MSIRGRRNVFTELFSNSDCLFLFIKKCFLAENVVSLFVLQSLYRSRSMHHNIYEKGVFSVVYGALLCNIYRSYIERHQICVIQTFNTQHKSGLYLLFGYKLYWYNLRNCSDLIRNLGVQILRSKNKGTSLLIYFCSYIDSTRQIKNSSDTANIKARS